LLDKKIERYKRDLELAKRLKKNKYADQYYYDELISKFEKFLRYYEHLKKYSEISKISNSFQISIRS
jgi:hypothetical protein